MTTYGFRLFEASLYSRTTQKQKLPYVDKSGWSYVNHLCQVLKSEIGTVCRGIPHDSSKFEESEDLDTNEDYKKLPLFRLLSFRKISDSTLLMEFESGRRSGHSNAMADPNDEEAEDLDIANHYPARTFRALLLTPAAGTGGILAVESISRACPSASISKWLSYWSEQYSNVHTDITSTDSVSVPWWTLRIKNMTDDETQERYIQQGLIDEIRVAKHAVTNDRKRPKLDYSLKAQLVSSDQRRTLGGLMRGWFSVNKEGNHNDDSRAAKQVAAIISKDFSEADFTDVEVSVTDPQTKLRKTMKPNDFADVFVYPICDDVLPDEKTLLVSIRGRVEKLSKSARTTIDWANFPSSLKNP